MRILHTADWHLGRSLKHWNLLAEQALVLDQLLEILECEAVDLLLIAGDFFDQAQPQAEALALANDFFTRLAKLDCQTLIIAGNHDRAELLSYGSYYFGKRGVRIISKLEDYRRPLVYGEGAERLSCYALPYLRRVDIEQELGRTFASLDEAFAALLAELEPGPQSPSLLLAHQFLAGAQLSESERSYSVGTAQALGAQTLAQFDYCALGHLHRAQEFRCGRSLLRYPGSPLAYSLSEAGQEKSWTLFTCEAGLFRNFSQIPVRPLRQLWRVQGTGQEILELARRMQEEGTAEGPQGQAYKLDDYYHIDLQPGEGEGLEARQLAQLFPRFLGLTRQGLSDAAWDEEIEVLELERQSPWELCQELYSRTWGKALDAWEARYVQGLLHKLEGEQ